VLDHFPHSNKSHSSNIELSWLHTLLAKSQHTEGLVSSVKSVSEIEDIFLYCAEDFFDTLSAHSNHPSYEPHIYAGDFSAYTAEEIESHITPLDSHTLFRRMGDTNPAHSPASPLTTATAPAADYRGRLLLNMLNRIEFMITNGRFPVLSPNHRPYTFFRKPNTYSILDYNLIAKRHGSLIRTCQVLQKVLPPSVTDHMPIHLQLDLPTSSNPVPPLPPHSSPARTLYHSKRLKDPQTKDTYTFALSKKVAKITPTFTRLEDSFSSSSTVYGNFTHNPQTGNFLSYNPSTNDTIRTKQTQHHTEAYISMTPSLNSLKVSSLLD